MTETFEAATDPLAELEFVVLGAGGLGCPALLGLVEGGARRLTIIDDDHVDASNLHRQVLFALADVGAGKAEAASWTLRGRARQPITIRTIERRLQLDQLDEFFAQCERPAIVLECSDDPRLKFAVHDACMAAGLPVVIAGVIGWRGQVMAVDPRRPDSACYRCVFEAPPPRELAPACVAVGVMGPVAGSLGLMMALLAIGLATDGATPAEPRAGVLLHFDFLAGNIRRLAPAPRPGCPVCSIRNSHHEHS